MGKSIESQVQSPSTPIWESENSEMYSSSPGTEGYVIWNCNPSDDGVKKYPSFDALDLLPHHYYRSDEEYNKARNSYRNGIYTDMRIDLNVYFSPLDKLARKALEVVVYSGEGKSQEDQDSLAA